MALLIASVPPVLTAGPAQAQPTGTLSGSIEFQSHGAQDNYPGPGAGSCWNFSLITGETYFHELALTGVDANGYAYSLSAATPLAGWVNVTFDSTPSCFLTPSGGTASGTMVSQAIAVRATTTPPTLNNATVTMGVTWVWTATALRVNTDTVTVTFANGDSFTAPGGTGGGTLTFLYATDESNLPQTPIGCDPHDRGRFVSQQELVFHSGPQVPRALIESEPFGHDVERNEISERFGRTCVDHDDVCHLHVRGTNPDNSFRATVGWEEGNIEGSTPSVCINDPAGDCAGSASAQPSEEPNIDPPSPYYHVETVCIEARGGPIDETHCTPEQNG